MNNSDTGRLYFKPNLATAISRPIDITTDKPIDLAIVVSIPSRVQAAWITDRDNNNNSRVNSR
jgi:hypothetical protein